MATRSPAISCWQYTVIAINVLSITDLIIDPNVLVYLDVGADQTGILKNNPFIQLFAMSIEKNTWLEGMNSEAAGNYCGGGLVTQYEWRLHHKACSTAAPPVVHI